jgi:hypothetical protein
MKLKKREGNRHSSKKAFEKHNEQTIANKGKN